MDYTKCITTDGKSYAAIEKIIAELAMKDYRRENPLLPNGKPKYRKHRPYSLSMDTLEALNIKKDYLSSRISETEYKAFCLRYNLSHV